MHIFYVCTVEASETFEPFRLVCMFMTGFEYFVAILLPEPLIKLMNIMFVFNQWVATTTTKNTPHNVSLVDDILDATRECLKCCDEKANFKIDTKSLRDYRA